MPILKNPRHEAFATELARGTKPSVAAAKAGFPEKSAASSGWRLSLYPTIIDRAEEIRRELREPAIAIKETVLRELGEQCEAVAITDEAGRRLGVYIPFQSSAVTVGA